MRNKSVVLALLTVGGVASAQPYPPSDTSADPAPPPPEDVAIPPQPEPPPPPPPAPAPPTVMEQPVDDGRPAGIAIGLGLGYASPIALDMPNISSLRLRLPTGLTFEPAFRISNTTSNDEAGGAEQTDKLTAFAVQALVRLPIVKRGKVDLELLGAAGFSTAKTNPEGDNNSTTTTALELGYGVAVTYWISQHWNFSMNVTNPLIDYRAQKVQTGIPGNSAKSTDTTIGVIFVPSVFMMVHLYN